MEDEKLIKIPPLAVYATLKEIHSLRRFQVLVYNQNKVELRIETKDGEDRTKAFEEAKTALKNYLTVQGIHSVSITLADSLPQQDENSCKFKHIVNMQNTK